MRRHIKTQHPCQKESVRIFVTGKQDKLSIDNLNVLYYINIPTEEHSDEGKRHFKCKCNPAESDQDLSQMRDAYQCQRKGSPFN